MTPPTDSPPCAPSRSPPSRCSPASRPPAPTRPRRRPGPRHAISAPRGRAAVSRRAAAGHARSASSATPRSRRSSCLDQQSAVASVRIGTRARAHFPAGAASSATSRRRATARAHGTKPARATRAATTITAKTWRTPGLRAHRASAGAALRAGRGRRDALPEGKDGASRARHAHRLLHGERLRQRGRSRTRRSTTFETANGYVTRRVKHFSGYNVVVD